MEFRSLFKNNASILSPKRCKRKEANEIRARKRSELYTSTRRIPLSPSPQNSEIIEGKENIQSLKVPAPEISGIQVDPKLDRKKAYLMKFLAWKNERSKQTEIKENSKRAPFRNIVSAPNQTDVIRNNKKTSFAPPNHIFRPTTNLQVLEMKVIGPNSVQLKNGTREEFYSLVATPKKKNILGPDVSSKKPISNKLMAPTTSSLSRNAVHKPVSGLKIKVNRAKSTLDNIKKMQPEVPKNTQPLLPSIPDKLQSKTQTAIQTNKISVQKGTLKTKTIPCSSPRKALLPKTKIRSDMTAIKRPTFKLPKKSNSSISSVLKTVTDTNRGTKSTKNGKILLKNLTNQAKQIPTKQSEINLKQAFSFLNVVTSTKRKSISYKDLSANSVLMEMEKLVSPVNDTPAVAPKIVGEKFNFLRYSVIKNEENDVKEKDNNIEHLKTPERHAEQQTPHTTYLSPYVSVSRGKVNIKVEKEKRDSLYMPINKSVTEDKNANSTTKIRHTLATVHYYRKQLKDEITRLTDLCDSWQHYKEANLELLEENGADMINVTIGQTKLLTTKKLKQFGDLIDQCEDCVIGKMLKEKGEKAKPILPEDLEGFWSMVCLQIENVDKRFANLQHWKNNNWIDPDSVPKKELNANLKIKKLKKKMPCVLKATAGPNKDLQKILKNAQAAFLRKKTGNNDDIILTPSKNCQVLIKDRRSRSAAATIITLKTPKGSRKSEVFDQTTPTDTFSDAKLLPHVHGFRKSLGLLKSTLLNNPDKKSLSTGECTTPLPPCRKSILKTPGSVRRPKSVIFNSPTLTFTLDDEVNDFSISQAENTNTSEQIKAEQEHRMYTLRNRKVKLRDSSEIIIPK